MDGKRLGHGALLRIALVAVIAGALVWNGAATLYAAATSPTIRACVKKSGPDKGLMRYVSGSAACAAGETALAWNVTGPTGPAGPQGPAGSGGSTAATYYETAWTWEPKSIGQGSSTKVTVPAGTYRIAIQVDLYGLRGLVMGGTWMTARTSCTYDDGSTKKTYLTDVDAGGYAWLTDEHFATFTTQTQLSLGCQLTNGATGEVDQVRLEAILYATPAILR